jgi:uncharacterized protein (DUF885 family)
VTLIEELARVHLAEACRLDPCLAIVEAGVADQDRLTDYGPDGTEERAGLASRTLMTLDRLPQTSDRDQLLAGFLRDRLGAQREFHASGEAGAELHNVATGPLQLTRQAVEAAIPAEDADPLAREAGWERVRMRMGELPAALAGYQQSLALAEAAGRVAAARQVEACREQCLRWASDGRNFADRYGRGPQRESLVHACDDAARAYAEFARFLRDVLAPRAQQQEEPFGPGRYRLWVRYFLDAELNLDELYSWGWEEFTRIEAELARETGRLDRDATAGEVIAQLDRTTAPDALRDPDAFRRWLQDFVDQNIQRLDGVHFAISAPLRRLECRIAPHGGVTYVGPSDNLARPGRIWWGIPADAAPPPVWRAYSFAYHEGVPGHHLQTGHQVCTGDWLTRHLGMLGGVAGHQEGWALYAERLMDELGYYTEPGARIGFLLSGLLRAARVVLDIGLHLQRPVPAGAGLLDDGPWTPALARQFLRDRCYKGTSAGFELARYLGRPAQALTYKIGERTWLEGRENIRRARGADFDLREFHATALNLDPLGLSQLRYALSHQAKAT